MPRGVFIRRPETRERMRLSHLGKVLSPETKEKIRQATLGKKLSPETREKVRQANLGRKCSPETKKKMHLSHLGIERSPETREKNRQSRLRQTFPTKMTSIEQSLFQEFKKRRLKFEMHKTMFSRWQPDFVFESAKLIVEADGDYWHRLPERHKSQEEFRDRAIAEGWTLWRFGEKEIQMHPAPCGRAVARFIRDHT